MKTYWPFHRRAAGMRGRLIVSLDVGTLPEATQLVQTLRSEVGMFKIGKQLFMHCGPAVVQMVRDYGSEVFLDLKFHDVPRTVAKAGVEATRLGVRMFDLHASGSLDMMQRTVSEVGRVCRTENLRRPKVLAVTVLTSLSHDDLQRIGVSGEIQDQVSRLALLAREAAMDGVVAPPQEAEPIRKLCGSGFLIVTPGIRPEESEPAPSDDYPPATPEAAIRAGADYLVVGQPIRDAVDPAAAARAIVAAMQRAVATVPEISLEGPESA